MSEPDGLVHNRDRQSAQIIPPLVPRRKTDLHGESKKTETADTVSYLDLLFSKTSSDRAAALFRLRSWF